MAAELIVLFVLPALLIWAGGYDLFSYTIPNPIQLLLIAGFAVFAFALPMGMSALGAHLLAALIGLAVGFALFALGYVGGGDAKLFACVGLWFGLSDLLSYTLVASVLGGGLTLGILAARQMPLPAVLARQGWVLRLHDEESGIPYGVALAAGALAFLPYTEIFRSAIGG